MDLSNIPFDKLGAFTVTIIAVVILWRAFVAGLAKRDADRAEVVAAYKLTADKAEEYAEEALAVIQADTAAMNKLVEEVAQLRAEIRKD